MDTVVPLTFRLFSIFCAVRPCTHSATLHFEQSAVSCWWRCPQSHLVS